MIQFVKSRINQPSNKKNLNLNNKERTDFSQVGQSKFIDSSLNSMRNGFFIEAGGYDGESYSVKIELYLNYLYIIKSI